MKRFFPLLLVLAGVMVISLLVLQPKEKKPDSLVVYAYDSFVSSWGPGPRIAELFEGATGISVEFISPGDAGQDLARLIAEKQRPQADVAVGIDNNLFLKAQEAEVLLPYRSKALEQVDRQLHFPGNLLTPYDYGHFAFIWDSGQEIDPPKSLGELTDPRFRDSIIVMDPRTSTPGLGLLLWTYHLYGEGMEQFWRDLGPNILTVTSGWDTGYGLFTSGEAPLVLSYTTSPAYHLEYEETERYQALLFPEGHYLQVEGAGIVKGTRHEEAAKEFIDFLLSEAVQEVIPLTNWMYPAREDIDLPESYGAAPKPEKWLISEPAPRTEEVDALIGLWQNALVE